MTSNVEATSETSLLQSTAIVIANNRYFFTVEYNFDGTDSSTKITYDDESMFCENRWTASTSAET